ncbi:Spore germination protein B1 [bioreactor metagenome]|uniref:Spore germination protein B1 n=1 Tax=bioreactor metagenome TaxID=1076179 RepID=A0A644XA30_9ZZZZ
MRKNDFDKLLQTLRTNGLDFSERSVSYAGGEVVLFFIAQLTDRVTLAEDVVKPLILHCSSGKNMPTAQETVNSIIYADICRIEADCKMVENYILTGMVVILFSNDPNYIVINLKKVEHRAVPDPQLTYTIRGPQDCFTENLDVNLSLLRNRVKDSNLRIKYFEVGARTKTRVAVIYIQDVTNDNVVKEIERRIESINVDGVSESGELQTFLLNSKTKFFPQMGIVERSDTAYHELTQGKAIVLTEGSGIAISAPKTFSEFFKSGDDRYDNKYFGMFSMLLRYLAIFIALTASSVFIAVTSFHSEVLPSDYAIALARMRIKVPFSALVGAILLEFIVELLREALLRVPKQIGPAIGIVGAIVIGQSAIAAGFFSPVLLTIAAVSLLASFAIPDYTLVNPFRVLKFLLIMFTGALGFLGFTVILTAIASDLVSLNSFGVPYMAPWAPFNMQDFSESVASPSTSRTKRLHYLRTKNRVRMVKKNDQNES